MASQRVAELEAQLEDAFFAAVGRYEDGDESGGDKATVKGEAIAAELLRVRIDERIALNAHIRGTHRVV